MDHLKDELMEKYKINDSIKEYKGYKVKSPEQTIEIIENAFDKIGLNFLYAPKEYQILKPYSPFQSGSAILFSKENDKIALLRTGGKGVTPILSKASATAELIERFTGYALAQGQISHYLSFYKYNELWNKKRKRNENIEKTFPFNYVKTDAVIPKGFEEKFHSLAKSVCYSLTKDKFYSYPEEFITMIDGSNGLASGNTFEEATIHAINEVIERLVGFHVLECLPKFKEISRDSVTHPTLKKLMDAIDSTGMQFKMLDFSHIFDVPVIITIFDHPEWDLPMNPYTDVNCEYPKMMVGVDTDPQDAAMRCFTEAIQSGQSILSAKSDYEYVKNKFLISNVDTSDKWKLYLRTTASTFKNGNQPMTVDLRKYLKSCSTGEVSIQDINKIYDINHKIEIKRTVEALKKHNIEVFVHDLTHPTLNFPVVRAIFSGGEGYFSKFPFIGYKFLIMGTDDIAEKYSFLNYVIVDIYGAQRFYKIIKDGTWCSSEDQTDFIRSVIGNASFAGIKPPLWGKNIYKFYFLGLLYLKMKDYKKAKDCFNAALYQNFNDIAPLLGLLYVSSKEGTEEEYKNLMDHAKIINRGNMDIEAALKEMDNPVIDPNPFELCDLDCDSKNKPVLCQSCFFNYASEKVFMKDFVDDFTYS